MLCPRCGTVNADQLERCARCRGSLAPRPPEESRIFTPPPVVPPAPPPPSRPADQRWEPPDPSTRLPNPAGRPAAESPEGADAPPAATPPPPPGGRPSAPGAPPPPPAWRAPAPVQKGWGPPSSPVPGLPRITPAGAGVAIPNYLGWAIVCTIFFFTPAGVVGVLASLVARRRARAGDLEGSQRASAAARTSCWVSLVLGLALYLLLATGAVHIRA